MGWNTHLPYETAEEPTILLNDIKEGLTSSVLAHDLSPGAVFWAKRLKIYMELKYEINVEDRIALIKCLYSLLILPGNDSGSQTLWASVLARLLKKHKQLKGQNLVLDWKPIYEIIKNTYFIQHREKLYVQEKNHSEEILKVLNHARRYFSDSATEEILETFRPLFFPFRHEIFIAQGFLVRFLPTNTPKIDSFLPELFKIIPWIQNLPNWNYLWLDLLSRIAEDRIGFIDWEPYIPFIFNIILNSVELPLGSIRLPPDHVRSLPSNCAIFTRSIPDKPKVMGKLMTYLITSKSSALKQLKTLFDVTEKFFHPASSGKWSLTLVKILQGLSEQFAERIAKEKEPTDETPSDFKLTDSIIKEFTSIVVPIALVSMFGKDPISVISSHLCLKTLAHIDPEAVFPNLLNSVYSSLDNLLESHRTMSSIGVLASLSTTLVQRKTNPNSNTSSEFQTAQHLLPLFHLTLPGIDVNDPVKAFSTLQFWINALMNVTLIDSTEEMITEDLSEIEMEIRSSTAQFEEWVLGFFDRIFVIFENMPEEKRKNNVFNIENGLTRVLLNVFEVLMTQLSPAIFEAAMRKTINYLTGNTPIQAVKGAGHLSSVLSGVNPQEVLKILIPICKNKIISEAEGRLHGRNISVNIELRWFQTILYRSISLAGNHILPYQKELFEVLEKTLALNDKKDYSLGAKLMKSIFKTTTSIYPRDARSVPNSIWKDPKFKNNHFSFWGNFPSNETPEINWHIPSQEEIQFTLDVIQKIVEPHVKFLEEIVTESISGAPIQDIAKSLTIIRYYLRGTTSLISPEPHANSDSAFSLKKRILNCGECLRDPEDPRYQYIQNLRIRILSCCQGMIRYFGNSREDEIKCIKIIIKIIHISISNCGVDIDKVQSRTQGYRHYKALLGDPTKKENTLPRYLIVKRAYIQHMMRLKQNAFSRIASPLEEQLITELFNFSIFNPYSVIRKKAQTSLSTALRCFPKIKFGLIGKIFDVLTNKGASSQEIKGSLYTLRLKCFRNMCTRIWKYQDLFMRTLVQAQYDEKPSIQELNRSTFTNFTMQFTTLSLKNEIKFNENVQKQFRSLSTIQIDETELQKKILHQEEKNSEDMLTYLTLTTFLRDFLKSQSHWRFELMAATFLELLIRKNISLDHGSLLWFYNSLTSELPQSQRLAITAVNKITLYSKLRAREIQNEPHKKLIQVNQNEIPKLKSNLFTPITEENWNQSYFVDQLYLGWYEWPTSFEARIPGKGKIETLDSDLTYLRNLLITDDFWKKFLSLMSHDSNTNSNNTNVIPPFNPVHAQFYKGIFKHFEDEFLDKVLQNIDKMIESTADRSCQRALSEFIAGLIRGSKNWPLEKLKKLENVLKPILIRIFDGITPDTLADWVSMIKFSFHRRDPRRNYWIIDLILKDKLSSEREYAFSESRKLSLIQAVLEIFSFRLSSESLSMLQHLENNLCHPYKNVRGLIGLCLQTIISTNWHPKQKTNQVIEEFVSRVITKLAQQKEETKNMTSEELLASSPLYFRTSKTVLCWLFETFNKIQIEYISPIVRDLLPSIFFMLDTNDQDLQLMSKNILERLPQQSFSTPDIPKILKSLEDSLSFPSWHVRVKTLPVYASFTLHFVFMFNENEMNHVLDVVIDKLADHQIEVRELASMVLSGLICYYHGAPLQQLIAKFQKNLQTFSTKKRKNEANDSEGRIQLHKNVLGLSSIILAFPYQIPEFLPSILLSVANFISYPAPIQTTVKKVLADFKRTHQDTWHLDKESFTEDQLEILSELLVSPSYYA